MPIILPFDDHHPEIEESVFVADNATITGNVYIGEESSIWYGTVIRGDVNHIHIGNRVSVQDLTMVHGSRGKQDTVIHDNVSIGHRAILHGCVIHPWVLVGMGAIIMDDVEIQSHVIVGAGSVVTEGKVLESGWIYAGVPAKKLKPISIEKAQYIVEDNINAYVRISREYKG